MRPRLTLALLAGRTAALVSRRAGHGGTALPGHIVPRIDPSAISRIARQLRHGSVLISGTNGKTTTARMVSHVAAGSGLHPIHNRSGANLMTGLASTIAASAGLSGRPRGDVGIFEVDEATLPQATQLLAPRIITLTNVFRDQLDRYGEVELVATAWRAAVASLSPSATLVVNADDPTIVQLIPATKARVLTYGFEDRMVGSTELAHDADRRLCPICTGRLTYSWTAYSHLGHYACPTCGWSRPRPDIRVTHAVLADDLAQAGTGLTIETDGASATIHLKLPGLYNAYNALAAASTAVALGVSLASIAPLLQESEAVFGRFERIPIGQGALVLALVKNPVGFNQVLRTLTGGSATSTPPAGSEDALLHLQRSAPPTMLIAINDLYADGTDVSWLWDVDFERLAEQPHRVLCTGLRAHDMALRLKYAGVANGELEPRLDAALDTALATASSGAEVLVFPTYTAMLELRAALQRRGRVAPFWED
jgi:UDP-N-acetylmuramyl tripeptide synthase